MFINFAFLERSSILTRDQLLEKSLGDLREIAKLQGVKSITKYRLSLIHISEPTRH